MSSEVLMISLIMHVLSAWCLLCACVAVSGEITHAHFTAVCPADSAIADQQPVHEIADVRSEGECGTMCVQQPIICRAFQVIRVESQIICQLFQWTDSQTVECEASTKNAMAYEVICPEPFRLQASTRSCYYVHPVCTDSHEAALTVCQQHHGAHLVSVESHEEQSALEALLAPYQTLCGGWLWFGGESTSADTADKSSWFWNIIANMCPLTYDNWGATEPHAGEPYMMVGSVWDYKWINVPNGFALACPVCEYEL